MRRGATERPSRLIRSWGAGHGGQGSDRRNKLSAIPPERCPSWFQNAVRHQTESCPSWASARSHLFITTNWDFLLQREVLTLGHTVQPSWSAETHVYHLNGTVEELPDNGNRSGFLLETDPGEQRVSTHEANIAFGRIIWNRTFVVVSMSFECETDKFILSSLNRVEDDLPIGESEWIIVNPDRAALAAICKRIHYALPRATIRAVASSFRAWLNAGMPELQARGAITI